jgi:hypothetical protein
MPQRFDCAFRDFCVECLLGDSVSLWLSFFFFVFSVFSWFSFGFVSFVLRV